MNVKVRHFARIEGKSTNDEIRYLKVNYDTDISKFYGNSEEKKPRNIQIIWFLVNIYLLLYGLCLSK